MAFTIMVRKLSRALLNEGNGEQKTGEKLTQYFQHKYKCIVQKRY